MSQPSTEQTSSWIAPGQQGFLVGESLYLRPPEPNDAKYPGAWHQGAFPISRKRAEDVLKADVPKDAESNRSWLIACRRDDDVPVGSVRYRMRDWRTASVTLHADPRFRGERAAITIEMMRIIVPWLSQECHNMVVWLDLDGPGPEEIAAAEALGMRPAACLREAVWRDGARHDQETYELLHPGWMAKLGDPGAGIADAGEPPLAAPAARRVSLPYSHGMSPDDAFIVSERVALRAEEPDDWKRFAPLMRQETETFFDRGRWLVGPLLGGRWNKDAMKTDPPKHMLLTVVARESGDAIGEVLLLDVDMFHRTAETGSMIFVPELRGKGIGSEAKLLLLEFAFDIVGLHMIRSFVWGPNTRSQAALRKQGYRDAGRLNWTSTVDDRFAEVRMFDLLASEWRARVEQADREGGLQ